MRPCAWLGGVTARRGLAVGGIQMKGLALRTQALVVCPKGATAAMPVEAQGQNPSIKWVACGRPDRRPQKGSVRRLAPSESPPEGSIRFSHIQLPVAHGSRTTQTCSSITSTAVCEKGHAEQLRAGTLSGTGGFARMSSGRCVGPCTRSRLATRRYGVRYGGGPGA